MDPKNGSRATGDGAVPECSQTNSNTAGNTPNRSTVQEGPIHRVTLTPLPSCPNPAHQLARFLKHIGRLYKLRFVDVTEVRDA